MKLGIFLIAIGVWFAFGSLVSLAFGNPAGSIVGSIIAPICFYFGIRRLHMKPRDRELLNKLNDNWVSDEEKWEIKSELANRGILKG